MRIFKQGILFGIGFMIQTLLWAQSSPIPMLETIAQNLIHTLEQNKAQLKSNHQIIYQSVQRYLVPHVDVEGMSRSVIGREAWKKATPAERREFAQVFTQLVIRTYSNPLAEYAGDKIQFKPLKGASQSRFIRINSIIVRKSGQRIPLNYSLVDKNGQWKIYDLSVEGVSLLQSFRSQFASILQNHDMHTLIEEMRKNKGTTS